MKVVTLHVAKTQLSRLIVEVTAGEQVVIARGKDLVVWLVPITPQKKGRVFDPYGVRRTG